MKSTCNTQNIIIISANVSLLHSNNHFILKSHHNSIWFENKHAVIQSEKHVSDYIWEKTAK